MLFRERGVKTVEAPLVDRNEMQATEIRKKMAMGEKWESLVPAPVAKIIKEINGIERVKTIAERGHR
jgi:nicotinamide-nucleotide adenylyltransferase